jgi:hypothetical protein
MIRILELTETSLRWSYEADPGVYIEASYIKE